MNIVNEVLNRAEEKRAIEGEDKRAMCYVLVDVGLIVGLAATFQQQRNDYDKNNLHRLAQQADASFVAMAILAGEILYGDGEYFISGPGNEEYIRNVECEEQLNR
jgi:hypothetical protein